MRLAVPLAIAVLAAALLGGCGDSDDGSGASTQAAPKAQGSSAPDSAAPAGATAHECTGGAGAKLKLRATGIPCAAAVDLAKAWDDEAGCAPRDGASRSSCEVGGGYRCLSVVTDRGVSVSCARPGRSIAFTAKRG